MGEFFLAVDGGASNCRGAIFDASGRMLCAESLPTGANVYQDLGGALATIEAVASAAAAGASRVTGLAIAPKNLMAGIGVAGANIGSCRRALAEWDHPFANAFITHDAHTACVGAHNGSDGAVIIVGTGICGCMTVNREVSGLLSGWGFPLADAGGAAWMGLRLLQETLLAHDNMGDWTPLTRGVLREAFASSIESLSLGAVNATPAWFGAFAPRVTEAFADGDPVAVKIVAEQRQHMGALVDALMATGTTAKVGLVGGGLAEFIVDTASDDLHSRLELKPPHSALLGAYLLARRAGSV